MSKVINCPSTYLTESTHVLGLVDETGKLKFLPSLLPINQYGLNVLTDADLRDKVRLTGPCVTSSCANWNGRCELGDQLAAYERTAEPDCAIRDSCRWRRENGNSVCGICTQVTRGRTFDDIQ